MLDLYFLLFVLAVGDHVSCTSFVPAYIRRRALSCESLICQLCFYTLSFYLSHYDSDTSHYKGNRDKHKTCLLPLKLDIFQKLKVDNCSVRSTTAVGIS